jgi:hypothetical protein
MEVWSINKTAYVLTETLNKAEYIPSDVGVWVYDDPIQHELGIPFHRADTGDEGSSSIAIKMYATCFPSLSTFI